jgi:hypothetical protein
LALRAARAMEHWNGHTDVTSVRLSGWPSPKGIAGNDHLMRQDPELERGAGEPLKVSRLRCMQCRAREATKAD